MTSMNLVLRPSTKLGRNEGSLSLRLIHHRRVKTVILPECKLYPEEWNRKSQEVVYSGNNPRRIAYLEKLNKRIFAEMELVTNLIIKLEKEGRYNLEDLMKIYRQRKKDSNLLGFTENLVTSLKAKGHERTANAYRTVTRGLVKFNKGVDIPLTEINSCLIKDFEKYLKDAGRLPNTISYYMRNLRAIYNKAIVGKQFSQPKDNPFTGVYMGVTRTMKRALSIEEIKKLYDLDLSSLLKRKKAASKEYQFIENLEIAHRYFFFCFYARGMSFIDLAYLRKENIRGGFVRYIRKKTGQQIEVRVTPEMQSIIDSFRGDVLDSSYVFPIIRDKDKNLRTQYETALRLQNYRLKRLALLAKIHKPVSTHWARHSWASTGKLNNIPIRVISECLGHTSEKTTLIYLNSLDNSLLDSANEIIISAVCRPHLNISSST